MPPPEVSARAKPWAQGVRNQHPNPSADSPRRCDRVRGGKASRSSRSAGFCRAIYGCRGAGQYSTTLRYRCQAACPITGKATARPMKTGTAPMNRVPAMMKPHIPIIIGFARTALIDV